MFDTAFTQLSGLLDKRFILTVWLPCMLFWSLLLGLVVLSVGLSTSLDWWTVQPAQVTVLLMLLAIAWITFFAYLVLGLLGSIIRTYEGYWPPWPFLGWFADKRKAYYREVAEQLYNEPAGYNQIYFYYPPREYLAEHAMPTRLGNILKNSELYPLARYKLDAVVAWPRLYSVLPDPLLQSIAEAKSSLDLMLVMSFLGALLTIFGSAIALVGLPWYAFLGCLWGGALLAWLGYQGAIRAALPYAQLIKTAFDLHRVTLLKALGWNAPTSYGEEREQWEQIGHLWFNGAPDLPEGAGKLGYPSAPAKNGEEEEPDED